MHACKRGWSKALERRRRCRRLWRRRAPRSRSAMRCRRRTSASRTRVAAPTTCSWSRACAASPMRWPMLWTSAPLTPNKSGLPRPRRTRFRTASPTRGGPPCPDRSVAPPPPPLSPWVTDLVRRVCTLQAATERPPPAIDLDAPALTAAAPDLMDLTNDDVPELLLHPPPALELAADPLSALCVPEPLASWIRRCTLTDAEVLAWVDGDDGRWPVQRMAAPADGGGSLNDSGSRNSWDATRWWDAAVVKGPSPGPPTTPAMVQGPLPPTSGPALGSTATPTMPPVLPPVEAARPLAADLPAPPGSNSALLTEADLLDVAMLFSDDDVDGAEWMQGDGPPLAVLPVTPTRPTVEARPPSVSPLRQLGGSPLTPIDIDGPEVASLRLPTGLATASPFRPPQGPQRLDVASTPPRHASPARPPAPAPEPTRTPAPAPEPTRTPAPAPGILDKPGAALSAGARFPPSTPTPSAAETTIALSAPPTTPAFSATGTTPAPSAPPTTPAPSAPRTTPAPSAPPTAQAPSAPPMTPTPSAAPTTPAPWTNLSAVPPAGVPADDDIDDMDADFEDLPGFLDAIDVLEQQGTRASVERFRVRRGRPCLTFFIIVTQRSPTCTCCIRRPTRSLRIRPRAPRARQPRRSRPSAQHRAQHRPGSRPTFHGPLCRPRRNPRTAAIRPRRRRPGSP